MPDKQNITISFSSVNENVNSFMVGSLITCKTEITNAYFAVFEGSDVKTPKDVDDPAIARYYLDAEECGACNAYVMGM